MKAWSYWLPDLMPHVPGCPRLLAEHELRRAAQAFFRQTRAWKITEAPLAIPALTATVPVAPADAGQQLVRIESAWWDGKPMEPVTAEQLDGGYADDWQSHTGTPTHYLQLVPGEIRLYPLPLSGGSLKLRMSVMPSDASTGLPDDLADRYVDEMHVGAKSRLMLYPGKPWTNPELAGVYGQAFNALVNQATAEAARAYAQARLPSRVNWC